MKPANEPLTVEELGKFASQLKKIGKWFKRLLGKAGLIAVLILSQGLYGCQVLRTAVRIVNAIPIPDPPKEEEIPIPEPTLTPTPRVIPTNSPTPTPTPIYSTPTPTPIPLGCGKGEFLDKRDGKCKLTPILGFWKVQGYNPKQTDYNCHNPNDGPKFMNNKVCVKDTTLFWCDPMNPGNCGPCDPDHWQFYDTFCYGMSWDNFEGPEFHIENATVTRSHENKHQLDVHFTPGVSFRFCVYPPRDFVTQFGAHVEIKPNAETCVTETYY